MNGGMYLIMASIACPLIGALVALVVVMAGKGGKDK